MKLCETLPTGANFKLYVDRFYTSFPLMEKLRQRQIWTIGTILACRHHKCPLKSDKELGGRGEFDWRVDANTGILVVKWKDTAVVHLTSNFAKVQPISAVERWSPTERAKAQVPCPNIVTEYNKYMGVSTFLTCWPPCIVWSTSAPNGICVYSSTSSALRQRTRGFSIAGIRASIMRSRMTTRGKCSHCWTSRFKRQKGCVRQGSQLHWHERGGALRLQVHPVLQLPTSSKFLTSAIQLPPVSPLSTFALTMSITGPFTERGTAVAIAVKDTRAGAVANAMCICV